MAEQAQRRASQEKATENPPADNSARDGNSPDSHAYEELRHLIVGPEQEGLKEIQERLDDTGRRIDDVSSVVAEAIKKRREQGDNQALAEALAPTIQDTLRESVRRDPHVLADALFPVMGPAIRKSITETLRSMLESFNTALEHSLSWQGLKWRVEAFRSGKPFSEVAMMHSLLFSVEQVFLIHRETGLVLSHVVAPRVATQDPSLVSGMLSAIQQFVKDSFESQRGDNTLDFLEVGELEVWIEQGPGAVLAAVIRGHAPETYRVAMKEALENIQRHYSSALAHFEGDAAPFRPVEEDLTHLLETQFKNDIGKRSPPPARRTDRRCGHPCPDSDTGRLLNVSALGMVALFESSPPGARHRRHVLRSRRRPISRRRVFATRSPQTQKICSRTQVSTQKQPISN